NPNPDIAKGATAFAWRPIGCTPGNDCTRIHALVLALDNVDPIPDGALLYTCRFAISTQAGPGRYPLVVSEMLGSDPDGEAIPVDAVDGAIAVTGASQQVVAASAGSGGCQVAPANSRNPNGVIVAVFIVGLWRLIKRAQVRTRD